MYTLCTTIKAVCIKYINLFDLFFNTLTVLLRMILGIPLDKDKYQSFHGLRKIEPNLCTEDLTESSRKKFSDLFVFLTDSKFFYAYRVAIEAAGSQKV